MWLTLAVRRKLEGKPIVLPFAYGFSSIVHPTLGGCGSFYAIHISSPQFKGLSTIKQHKLVNQCLKEEVKAIHGLQVCGLSFASVRSPLMPCHTCFSSKQLQRNERSKTSAKAVKAITILRQRDGTTGTDVVALYMTHYNHQQSISHGHSKHAHNPSGQTASIAEAG